MKWIRNLICGVFGHRWAYSRSGPNLAECKRCKSVKINWMKS